MTQLVKICSLAIIICLLSSPNLPAADGPATAKSQTIYVPVYSNIFSAPRKIPFNLAVILSIRNTDPTNSISVSHADYYDTKGKLLRKYLTNPVMLLPLESTDIFIPEDDTAGGVGANFLVTWHAAKTVNAPIVEAVMIGMKSGQGISFVSKGRALVFTGK